MAKFSVKFLVRRIKRNTSHSIHLHGVYILLGKKLSFLCNNSSGVKKNVERIVSEQNAVKFIQFRFHR